MIYSPKRTHNNFKKVKKILEKKHYAIFGNSSGVQICNWTKNSLNNKGVCWKEKFYGIKSHRCCQMSPAVMWCDNQCIHCWRPIEHNLGRKIDVIDEPKDIIEGIIKARKKLMSGFGGNKKVNKKKLIEAKEPTLFTFSLSGEPTLYPKLSGLIDEVRKRNAVSFLVTNGLHPEAIKILEEKNSLPTQLTISTNAPNKKLFLKWHRSLMKNSWEKFNETIELVEKLEGKVRRVIRLTLAKGNEWNNNMKDEHVKEYADLIRKANPDFIHAKGFKAIGYSRQRMSYKQMPTHHEIKKFAKKLEEELKDKGYKILGEEKRSAVVLLGKNKKDMKITKV